MKTTKWIAAGLLASVGIVRAQLATITDASAQPDSIVQITAEAEGLSRIDPTTLPLFASCWWTVYPNGGPVPLPCPPQDLTVPIYEITAGIYLVDETGGSVSVSVPQSGLLSTTSSTVAAAVDRQGTAIANLIEQVQGTQTVQAMAYSLAAPMPGDGSSSTNSSSTNVVSYVAPDYGTNLWVAPMGVDSSGYLTGIGSNTLADVQYEIQSRTNLAQTDWQSEGYIYGSELTNWTPLSVAQNGRVNLFIRLKSWASSDGSGLPDWWEALYFGTNGVDPNANPAGDGWSNIQKLQNGWNPNQFYTPAAPQGLQVQLNQNTQTAALTWLPSAGNVINYTVEKTYQNNQYGGTQVSTFTTSVANCTDSLINNPLADWNKGAYAVSYRVQANYIVNSGTTANNVQPQGTTTANSDWSQSVGVVQSTFSGQIVAGPGGVPFLAVASMPANTVSIRLTKVDEEAYNFGGTILVTNFTIPVSGITNGVCALPNVTASSSPDTYYWVGQAVGANGQLSTSVFLALDNNLYVNGSRSSSMEIPFFDGRMQLKQNLIFKLRAAQIARPFSFNYDLTDATHYNAANDYITAPASYVYSGYYRVADPFDYAFDHQGTLFDALFPFQENALNRNFAFSLDDVDPSSGIINTGVERDNGTTNLYLASDAVYQLQISDLNWTTLPGLLPTNSTRWLCTIPPIGGNNRYYRECGVHYQKSADGLTATYSLDGNAYNYFGLKFTSAELLYGSVSGLNAYTLNAGGNVVLEDTPYVYAEAAQPQFQTVSYDFWNVSSFWNSSLEAYIIDVPGNPNFAVTNTGPLLVMPVGSTLKVAGYAKLAVANSIYSGVYAYLGQYFDKAYKVNDAGNLTSTNTGILSPYGDFLATEPGKTALVTLPDLDTGERGTCMVYSVSMVVDRTQGSNMDATFNGPNATSAANPAQVWANNNFDRGHTVDGSDFEQDDLGAVDIAKLPAYQQVPDCNYVNASGQPAIPSTRDLEDYFRLWLPGVGAAMKAMPTNFTVRLTLTGDGQIRIFRANEPSGGTNYLFDETTASNQVANSASLYVGLLTSSSSIPLPVQTNFNEHFIICGAHTGSAQVDLQILDGNQNIVVDTAAYLQIQDIKQMYERWTVGDDQTNAVKSVAVLDASDLGTNPPVPPAFEYPLPQAANTPYILLVHGWNMERWEKDRYAETAFKRLYWQGYKGRFGFFRWPTGNKFSGIISAIFDGRNYDNSEYRAWQSATGLTNLLTKLNMEYPGRVYLMAHSMGNVVAGEALRRAGSQLVNTYVAMQGAVSAHCYDSTTVNRTTFSIPDRQAHYWTDSSPSYFSSSAGAGNYVNFYNTNDFALGWWNVGQNMKPDIATSPGYHYSSSSGFYKIIGTGTNSTTYLSFPGDTFEIFAYGDPAWSYALGAQANVGGAFTIARQVVLPSVWPIDTHSGGNYSAHVWHSAQFRSDNMSRTVFWNSALNGMRLIP